MQLKEVIARRKSWRKIKKPPFALLLATMFATMFLAGCGALHNPLCGTARPKPVLIALSPNPATLAQVDQGLLLTITGSNFYSDSLVIWNGAPLPTTVTSSTVMEVTITTTQISSPGTAQILVHTPPNLSGDLGCDSGGDSDALTFTVN
jgi:hypothetical protein